MEGGFMSPHLSTATPFPPVRCPPHRRSASAGTPQKWGHHKIPQIEHTGDQPNLEHHSPSFQGDPHCRTQRVPELGAFQGLPRLRCPWVGGSLWAGVPGLWARCRCPLPVPARPGLGVAHILPLPRTQSSRRGRPRAGRAPWIPGACPRKRQPVPGAATRVGQRVGLRSPHRWEQGPCVSVPSPRSAWGWLAAAGAGLLSPPCP